MTQASTTRTMLMIAGMRDNACRQKIAEALASIKGVKEANVNLYRACATIVHDPHCQAAALARTVSRAGYLAETNR